MADTDLAHLRSLRSKLIDAVAATRAIPGISPRNALTFCEGPLDAIAELNAEIAATHPRLLGYLDLEHAMLLLDGLGDVAGADALRDKMDACWRELTDEDHALLDGRTARARRPVGIDAGRFVVPDDFDDALRLVLDLFLEVFDAALRRGEWARVDHALETFDFEGANLDLAVTVLQTVRPAAEHLPARERALERLQRRLEAHEPDRVEAVMRPLRV